MARNRTFGYTPAREHRRVALGVSAAVLAAIVGAGGFLLGRATVERSETPAAGGLPMRQGIPIPDRRTPAGAATAAQNFQIAGYRVGSANLDPTMAAAVLLSAQAEDNAHRVLVAPTSGGGPTPSPRTSYAPLSTVVVSFAPERAEVQVWGVATTSSLTGQQPAGTENWGRSTVIVVWEDAQWRVLSQRYEIGPWPVRADARLAESDGDFSFRTRELLHGWTYVPET